MILRHLISNTTHSKTHLEEKKQQRELADNELTQFDIKIIERMDELSRSQQSRLSKVFFYLLFSI